MPHIIGERIVLREFRAEDISGIRAWCNDPQITRYLSGRHTKPIPWEQSAEELDRFLRGDAGGVNLVVAQKEGGRYMGQVSLFMIDHQARKAELAIVLGPESVGQGYGSEAMRLLVAFGFDQINLNRIYLTVNAQNARAIRLYERSGFVREGVLRQDRYYNGQYEDVLMMSILREEYYAHV
jgi:RimJ/RimL family protein N-acetyltransferase